MCNVLLKLGNETKFHLLSISQKHREKSLSNYNEGLAWIKSVVHINYHLFLLVCHWQTIGNRHQKCDYVLFSCLLSFYCLCLEATSVMDEWMFSLPPPQLQHCLPVYLLLSRAHSQSSGGTQHHEPPSAPDHKLSGPAPPGGAGALFPGTEGRTQEPLWQGEAAFTVCPREWLYLSRPGHARGGRLIRISITRPT